MYEFCKQVGEGLARFEELHLHLADRSVRGTKEVCANMDGIRMRRAGLVLDTGFDNDAQGVAYLFGYQSINGDGTTKGAYLLVGYCIRGLRQIWLHCVNF